MVHQEYFSKMKKTAAMLNLWVKFVGEIDFVPPKSPTKELHIAFSRNLKLDAPHLKKKIERRPSSICE